jgi:mRNA interferase MazF
MNRNIGTVIVAPMTTTHKEYPTRVNLSFQGKTGSIVLDQIRTIDKRRLIKELGTLDEVSVIEVKQILKEMLVD